MLSYHQCHKTACENSHLHGTFLHLLARDRHFVWYGQGPFPQQYAWQHLAMPTALRRSPCNNQYSLSLFTSSSKVSSISQLLL